MYFAHVFCTLHNAVHINAHQHKSVEKRKVFLYYFVNYKDPYGSHLRGEVESMQWKAG